MTTDLFTELSAAAASGTRYNLDSGEGTWGSRAPGDEPLKGGRRLQRMVTRHNAQVRAERLARSRRG